MFSYSAETSHSIYPFTVSTQPPPARRPDSPCWLPLAQRPSCAKRESVFRRRARTHARTHPCDHRLCYSSFCSQFPLAFALIFLSWSEVVFRDVACHPSARPIKHTVMTDWPRSKLITDWLTERGAPFCSAVFDSCLPDV